MTLLWILTLEITRYDHLVFSSFTDLTLFQGIHIGEHFFPTEFAREQKSHEIFTLASNKAQAPLRHYASVEGKILVKRVLNEKISDRVKKSNEASVKKAKARPIQLLDAPPAKGKAAPKATKKKSATTKVTSLHARNASLPSNSAPSVTPVRNPSTSTTPARVHSPLPSPNPRPALTEAQSLMRYRLIHFLALTPKTSADVIRNIGGSTCDLNTRSQISTCLSQVNIQAQTRRSLYLLTHLSRLRLKTHLPGGVIQILNHGFGD